MKYLQYVTLILLFISISMNIYLKIKYKRMMRRKVFTIIKSSILNMKERYIRLKESGAFEGIPCENIEKFLYVCMTLDDFKKIKYRRKTLLKKENLISQINILDIEEKITNKELKLFLEEYRKLNDLIIKYYFPYKAMYYNFVTFIEILIIIFIMKFIKKENEEEKIGEIRDSDSYLNFDVVANIERIAA